MEDFNSKYSGEQIENLLDQMANGNTGGGGITAESDPIFSASPAAAITNDKIAEWNNKVDKIEGKQLSTEDFTTALKNKLSGLENYDDTALNNALTQLRTEFDTLVGENASLAIDTFNEIVAFLNGVSRADDLSSIISSIEQQIAGKQATISDLATIRSGAAAGATAVQPGSLSKVATSGSYNDLSNKPTIPDAQVNADWNATSGKAQILNKPTIPTAVTESTVSGWGFTKNAGTVTGVKINGTSVATSGVANIPAASTSAYGVTKLSDAINSTSTALAATANAVKKAYDLANSKTANTGTITEVKMNGASKGTSGSVDLGSVVTQVKFNGFTYEPTNGLVNLGNLPSGGNSGSPVPYPVEVIYVEDETYYLTPNPNTYYQIWLFENFGPAELYISINDTDETVANEYVFEIHNGIRNAVAFTTDIVWVSGPPEFSDGGTLISICLNTGLWVNIQ